MSCREKSLYLIIVFLFKSIFNTIGNNPINIEHTLDKIKAHEKEATIITVCIMILIISLLCLIFFTSFGNGSKYNIYDSDSLIVKYSELGSGYSNVVTLGEKNVLSDSKGLKDKGHKFDITNKTDNKIKYQILLDIDEEMIKLDNCYELLVNDNSIKYSFDNKANYLYEGKDSDKYVLYEDFLNEGEIINHELKIWINDEDILEKNNNHFHGNIIVKIIKKY